MRKFAIISGVGCTLLALNLLLGTSANSAPIDESVKDAIDKIAKALETGDEAGAKKEATALDKKTEELNDVMYAFKPRSAKKNKGIGVGPKAGAIIPDGIEQKINAIARDGITATELKKEGAALNVAAMQTAAIAEFAIVRGWKEKETGKQTKAAWQKFAEEMKASAKELATSVKGDSPANVKTVAVRLNNSCNNCHMVFRKGG